ncbi:MAG TPA: arylsulfatase, partial [Planctomycetaceae bacterium]|nr:arylsulfatase [Planctomycetaceae bacterium]
MNIERNLFGRTRCAVALCLLGLACRGIANRAQAADAGQPNVVIILMDNFGYGELGCYGGGITRGAPTPRIDQLASQGFRSTNFNVEAQCTPSRAALLTGRYAIRTGNAEVPIEPSEYGLVQWEYTLAEMFAEQDYATGMFGKWHLGDSPGRYPIDQGFDEWYGIPNSTDEAFWPDNPRFVEGLHPLSRYEHVLSGRKGEEVKQIEVYDLKKRALIDDEFTTKAIDFMQRSHRAGKPFFTYIPYTQTHMPVTAHPDFAGKTKNGKWADILAQTDDYVGRILDAIDQMGVADDTIVIFTADNGPESQEPHEGFSGMWRGSYFTGLEGSLRVPFIMRWPGKVPAGMVSNE